MEDKQILPKRWHERWPVRLLLTFLALLLVLSVLPYLFPVSTADSQPPDVPFTNSRFASIEGISLHYRVWESQSEECLGKVLLIHGLGGSTFSWEQTADALSKAGYWVMAADLPGFGYSSRQTGLDHSQQARANLMWQLLDSVTDQTPTPLQDEGWVLIGHSMGAGTVAAMALAGPNATGRLIFVDGALLDQGPAWAATLMGYPPAGRWLAVALENWLINRQSFQNILASAYGSEPTAAQVEGYLQPLLLKGTARCLVDLVQTSRNEPVDGLKDAPFPIDAIWGEQDTFVPVSQAAKLQQLLPAMHLQTIDGAGHIPMETHSVEFNQILLDILNN